VQSRTHHTPHIGEAVVSKQLLGTCVRAESIQLNLRTATQNGPCRSKAKFTPSEVVFKLDMIHACTGEEKPRLRNCTSTSLLLLQGLAGSTSVVRMRGTDKHKVA
jgi:hypothetical protein